MKIIKLFIKKIDWFNLFFPAIQNIIELETMTQNEINRIKINNWKLSQNLEEYNKIKKELDEKFNSTAE